MLPVSARAVSCVLLFFLFDAAGLSTATESIMVMHVTENSQDLDNVRLLRYALLEAVGQELDQDELELLEQQEE